MFLFPSAFFLPNSSRQICAIHNNRGLIDETEYLIRGLKGWFLWMELPARYVNETTTSLARAQPDVLIFDTRQLWRLEHLEVFHPLFAPRLVVLVPC